MSVMPGQLTIVIYVETTKNTKQDRHNVAVESSTSILYLVLILMTRYLLYAYMFHNIHEMHKVTNPFNIMKILYKYYIHWESYGIELLSFHQTLR